MAESRNGNNIRIRENIGKIDIKSYLRNNDELLQKSGYIKERIIDCSLGVNPFGYSEYIDGEINNIKWKEIYKYPNPNYENIKSEIINYWSDTKKIKIEELHLGFGAIGIICILLRLFCEKNTKALGYVPQFNEFENLIKIAGGEYEYINLGEEEIYKFNKNKMLKAIKTDHSIVYIDNPNNPTGQIINIEDIEEIAKKSSEFNIPLIIDEAYGDFMSKANSAINLIDKYPNLIVIRSFSKAFGLANIRLGYVIMKEEIGNHYKKVNIPVFVFPDIFQNLVMAALKDKEFINHSIKAISKNKNKFINDLNSKFNILSTSNTVPILTMGIDKDINLREKLLEIGIISCDAGDFSGLKSNHVRIRIPKETDQLIDRLKYFK